MSSHFFDRRQNGNRTSIDRRLFIDLGSNYGQSVEAFSDWKADASLAFDVFCFEPNLEFIPELLRRVLPLQSRFNDLQILPIAAYDNDCILQFDGWQLSEFGQDVPYRRRLVPALDFANWLSTIIDEYIEVILKIDIEGAEYKLIEALSKSHILSKVSQLFIEIHFDRSGHTPVQSEKLINTIYMNGLTPCIWECDKDSGLMYDPSVMFAEILPSRYFGPPPDSIFSKHNIRERSHHAI